MVTFKGSSKTSLPHVALFATAQFSASKNLVLSQGFAVNPVRFANLLLGVPAVVQLPTYLQWCSALDRLINGVKMNRHMLKGLILQIGPCSGNFVPFSVICIVWYPCEKETELISLSKCLNLTFAGFMVVFLSESRHALACRW